MPPILMPAPVWSPDRSDYVILWHGCTAHDKASIEAGGRGGLDPTRGEVGRDFGRGFYTTTVERQARQWAWHRYYQLAANDPTATGNQPVILRFRVRRYTVGLDPLEAGLDELAFLMFVLGDHSNEDYWSLVQHCRQSAKGAVNDHRRGAELWYDVVAGPVSAFWSQRVAMDDADQFSFHTEAGLKLLNALIRAGLQNGVTGDPRYYQWFPVP